MSQEKGDSRQQGSKGAHSQIGMVLAMSVVGPDPRALRFGDDTEQYDAARPPYPDWVFDLVTAERSGGLALDVGCGTGAAGRQLRERGWQVRGVEPDGRMAEVARQRGLEVDEATFEAWDPHDHRFDLVVSAQAWHWVDPIIGPAKAAEVLVEGGRFAAFWNGHRHAPEVASRVRAVYMRHASEVANLPPPTIPAGGVEGAAERGLAACSLFRNVERRAEPSARQYTVEEWLEVEKSFGSHRVYPSAIRPVILEEISDALSELAPITVTWTTTVVSARRST